MSVPKLIVASLLALAIGSATILGTGAQSEELWAAPLAPFSHVANSSATLDLPRAEVTGTVTSTVSGTLTSTLPLTGTFKIIAAITQFFSGTVTGTEISELRSEGWGFGGIFKLFQLAKETNKTTAEIKALRDSGMGWGQIAKELDVSPGNKGNNLGAAVSGRGSKGDRTTVGGDNNSSGSGFTPPGLLKKGNTGQGIQGQGSIGGYDNTGSGKPGGGNGNGKSGTNGKNK